jgi:hypothetical protein
MDSFLNWCQLLDGDQVDTRFLLKLSAVKSVFMVKK